MHARLPLRLGTPYYATVGLQGAGIRLTANFGRTPFTFDPTSLPLGRPFGSFGPQATRVLEMAMSNPAFSMRVRRGCTARPAFIHQRPAVRDPCEDLQARWHQTTRCGALGRGVQDLAAALTGERNLARSVLPAVQARLLPLPLSFTCFSHASTRARMRVLGGRHRTRSSRSRPGARSTSGATRPSRCLAMLNELTCRKR